MDNCIYNLIYTKFNEEFKRENYFSYNLEYPTFYNFRNTYFKVNPSILSNISSTIKTDINTFKEDLQQEEENYNKSAPENNLPNRNYKAISNYAVTFNKNHILSAIVSIMGFSSDDGPEYNDLYNYNFDLLTGNRISLKDIFNRNVDYLKVITDYINYKISQDKDNYYSDSPINIPDDQAFYLTDDGIVIYFGVDEIAPESFGIPKFKMEFSKFAPYINPRFYCNPNNIYRYMQKQYRK